MVQRRALVSVSDKTGLVEFVKGLQAAGWQIIATGGTQRLLEESGIRSIYGCMVVGLEEGKENLSPVNPKRRFQEGDIIWVVGEQNSINTIVRH